MSEPLPVVPAREGYDRWAPAYDAYDNPLIALEEPVVTALCGDVTGRRIADIGCGTGRHALRLAAAGAEVTAVDFSSGMMDALKAKGLPSGLRLVEHDLRTGIPLPSDHFDLALSCLVLEHVPDLRATIAELGRICRPGGRVIVTDLHPEWTRRGLHARFREAKGAAKIQIEGEHHRICDYVMAGVAAGLELEEIDERAMDEATAAGSASAQKYRGEPLLLSVAWRRPL
ncbi:MAG: class I SAM-dependent methyltransferase [Myxococcota bacterium]